MSTRSLIFYKDNHAFVHWNGAPVDRLQEFSDLMEENDWTPEKMGAHLTQDHRGWEYLPTSHALEAGYHKTESPCWCHKLNGSCIPKPTKLDLVKLIMTNGMEPKYQRNQIKDLDYMGNTKSLDTFDNREYWFVNYIYDMTDDSLDVYEVLTSGKLHLVYRVGWWVVRCLSLDPVQKEIQIAECCVSM